MIPRPVFDLARMNRAAQVRRLLTVAGITADDIIDQLVLTRRLEVVDRSTIFFKDHVERYTDGAAYLDSMERAMAARLGGSLRNKLMITWTERDASDAAQTIKTARVCVLVGENYVAQAADDDGPEGLQGVRAAPRAHDDGGTPDT